MPVNFLIQNVRNEENVDSNSLGSFLTFSSSSPMVTSGAELEESKGTSPDLTQKIY